MLRNPGTCHKLQQRTLRAVRRFGLWFRAEGFDLPPTGVAPGAAYLRFGIGHTLAIVLLLFYLSLLLQEVPTNRSLAAEKGRFLLLKLGYMGLFAQFTPGIPLWDRRLPARTLLSMSIERRK
jgi:hypothetical protein